MEVKINREIRNYTESMFFGLSLRQFVFSLLAVGVAVLLITFLILNTNDDIMICDPEGEYAPLIEAMGDLGSVIRVSAGGRDRLNAMYMVDGYGENNPIVVKSEFIMSLIEQIDKKGVGPQHKSIIDRCITNVYRNAADTGTIPTLCTLRDMLLEQPEPEAKQIALSLELYTTGSLDIFGKQSNVDLDKRVVVFDIHGLGSQLMIEHDIAHPALNDTDVFVVDFNDCPDMSFARVNSLIYRGQAIVAPACCWPTACR